jgi:hypothetical protein
MMNRHLTSAFALSAMIVLPVATLAAPHGGGGGGGGAGGGGGVRQSTPAFRPAPAPRPAPPNAGGFNFNHDINARPAPVAPRPVIQPPPAAQPRPIAPPRTVTEPRPQNRPPANYPHPPNSTTSGGPYRGRFVGPVVRNVHAPPGNWAWNRGVVWHPAPVYWGGGFWGPFALSALGSSLLFGSIVDDQAQLTYPSYQVDADTPGWDLLQDYQLQQTPCGPPDLVVIWGPDDSVICAFPNATVGPGNYQVDPATFTLVPAQ